MGAVDELEPERPARLVQVEPVRILVVRDVEIDAPVTVRVREQGAEAVVVQRVEARRRADLAELPAALVQEEQVTNPEVVARESLTEPVIGCCMSV